VRSTIRVHRNVVGILLALSCLAFGQTSAFDGFTPKGLEPGSPAGSYLLSGLDTINLYNGSANVSIPLLTIGGRGEAGYTMYATPTFQWNAVGAMSTVAPCSQQSPCPVWSMTDGWADWNYRYRPAAITTRSVGYGLTGSNDQSCPNIWYANTLTRITVVVADGTQMELHDTASGGAIESPSTPANCQNPGPFDRGKTWVSADGSASTFFSDSDIIDPTTPPSGTSLNLSGTLYFRDGRQFRFDSGSISWIQDRNGNRTTFQTIAGPNPDIPGSFAVTDPLGRTVQVTIGNAWGFTSPESGAGYYDEIRFPGVNSAYRYIRVYRRLYLYDSATPIHTQWPTLQALFAGYASSQQTPTVLNISNITLPDGHTYQFQYSPYGEVSRLTVPTGGAFEYDWTDGPGNSCFSASPVICNPVNNPDLLSIAVYRRLSERREYVGGGTGSGWSRRTTYTVSELNQNTTLSSKDPLQSGASPYRCSQSYCTDVEVAGYDPVQGLLATQRHYYYGAASQGLFSVQPVSYPAWSEGREFLTATLSPGAVALRTQVQTWQQRLTPSWWTAAQAPFIGPEPGLDTRVVQGDESIDNGKMARRVFGYPSSTTDNTNNQIDLSEYDYGGTGGSQGSLLRKTHTDFVTDTTYTQAPVHLRSLPLDTIVYNASSNTVAQTQYCYDKSATDSSCSSAGSLTADSGIVNNVTVSSQRGNATHVKRWRNTDGALLTTITSFDVAGNKVKVTNPLGYSTSITYEICPGAFAFVTSVTNAKSQKTNYNYDCSLGKPISITDPNNFQTTIAYGNAGADLLDRPSLITRPNSQQTQYTYSTDLSTVTTNADRDAAADRLLQSDAVSDGFGRTIMTRIYAPEGVIVTKKDLDALGRTRKTYNPVVGTPSMGTSYGYDALGRAQTITYADASSESFQWTGDTLLHTDASGTKSQQQVDTLSRVLQVIEDPGTPPTQLNYTTSYAYDPLDDLISVTQGAQTRYFTYDSLKELRSAKNPEPGFGITGATVTCDTLTVSVCYTYDANGNLANKVAAGVASGTVQTTYTYDQLDRPLTKSYVDATSTVSYAYDTAQIGCLDSVSNGVSTTSFTSYEKECRMKTSTQTPSGQQAFPFQYTYNLTGALHTETYPSGRTITIVYDIAGRPNSVAGVLSTVPTTYASGITYQPFGPLSGLPLGNGVTETAGYNNRMQMTSLTAVKGGTTLLGFGFNYAAGSNNGNLQSQTIHYDAYGPETALSLTQNYVPTGATYDAANRLKGFVEGSITQNYGYDQYGNRWVPTSTGYTLSGLTPIAQSTYTAGNNRMVGVGYDNRGNQTLVSPYPLAYDQEDRQTSAVSSANGSASYAYDGNGRRVQKMTCNNTTACTSGSSNLTTTSYVYDAFGQLVAEYGSATGSSGTEYLTDDHLGSTRLVTDGGANVLRRYDYLPFGEQLGPGVNGRSSKYSTPGVADGDSVKFTGKERDAETGLDYFGARYMSSAQGRFTSADPITVTPARVEDPQQLNLYAYARNNPLKYIDPTGMIIDTDDLSEKDKKKWAQIVALANKQDANGNYVNKNLHDAYTALDQDSRTFSIENSKLAPSTAGLFTITEFSGSNDFTKATLQLDFSKIQSVSSTTAADLVPGFNKFEGILGDKIKQLAETFGHEANHGVFAIQNPADAVGLQRLLNDRDASMKASGYPFPPDVMKKIDDANKGLIPTERFAQQAEKLINGELRAQDKKK
jgi:RHS repeat-associated protein